MEEKTFVEERIPTHTSVNVTIYFNGEMDEPEIKDFVENALDRYCHPDHVVNDYEYWYDQQD